MSGWPRGTWALGAIGLLLTVWYLVTSRQDFVHLAVADLAFLLLSGLAAAVCLRVGLRAGAPGRPWRFLGLGCLAWSFGQVVWNVYELVWRVPVPYPSLADVGYLTFYPFFGAGLVLLVRANGPRTPALAVALDGLIVAAVGGIIVFKLMIAPLFAPGHIVGPAFAASLAWVVGTIALLFLSFVALVWSSPDGDRRPLTVLLLGTAAFSVANVVYGRLSLDGGYYAGHRIDLGWHFGFLLVAAAALLARQSGLVGAPGARADEGDPSAVARTVITVASVLAVSWLAAHYLLQDGPDPLLAGAIVVVGVLLAGRLAYATVQANRLADQTRARHRLERDAVAAAATEAALAQRADELERSNADLEQFAYVASHDLQEPLRMVSSYTQLLARRYRGKLDADADEFIGYAVDGVTRMQQLINDLLAYSRAGRGEQAFVATDLETVLARVLANLRVAIEESGATVTYDPLPTVIGETGQLAQLFQNLVANAIKFRGDAPPDLHIGALKDGGMWRITVRDNGIGIEPQYAERIFLLFQRLHTRAEYPGTGIGLAICKKIVERHGGRIGVAAEPGAGTEFVFTLPATEDGR